ncbi:MAG: hypothetical protein AAF270_08920 [Pseudomonadota bacterium]
MVDHTCQQQVLHVHNLRDFFRSSIDDVLDRQGVRVEPQATQYVVNLMTMYARSESLFEHNEDVYGLRPLALMLADAADAPSSEARSQLLQRIGDVALFMGGFLIDGLADNAVDVDYYINMGESAYGSLSQEIRGTLRGDAFAPIYQELASKFSLVVDVLNEVRDGSAEPQSDILRVYEVWRKTGSARALAQLRAHGIEPLLGAAMRHRH